MYMLKFSFRQTRSSPYQLRSSGFGSGGGPRPVGGISSGGGVGSGSVIRAGGGVGSGSGLRPGGGVSSGTGAWMVQAQMMKNP